MNYPDNPDPIRKRNNIDIADHLLEARLRKEHQRSWPGWIVLGWLGIIGLGFALGLILRQIMGF